MTNPEACMDNKKNSALYFQGPRHLRNLKNKPTTVFEYIRHQSERMKTQGRPRTSETYRQALRSFMEFRNGVDLDFDMVDAEVT